MNVLKAAEYIMGNPDNTVPVKIHINLDRWPGETKFDVLDSNGKMVMQAGPYPFSSLGRHGKMKEANHEWNLKRGCYTLVMKDLAEDG